MGYRRPTELKGWVGGEGHMRSVGVVGRWLGRGAACFPTDGRSRANRNGAVPRASNVGSPLCILTRCDRDD